MKNSSFTLSVPVEVAGDLVGDEDGLVGDFGLAVGVEALLADADDSERNAVDADAVANGSFRIFVKRVGQRLDKYGYLGVEKSILIVEEAAGDEAHVTDDLVLGRDAKKHNGLGEAGANGDCGVVLQHGRRGDDAGHLGVDGVEVLAGHVVWRTGVVRPHDASAAILHFDLVGANGGELLERILLAGETECGDEDDGR